MPSRKGAGSTPNDGGVREEQLISIAAELFARKGYEGTSLRDISEAAGITKAALYYWFPEKEALFRRVVIDRMSTLVERVSVAVDQANSPIDKIRAFLRCSAERIDADRAGWINSSSTFWSNADPEQREAAVPERDRFEGLLRGCVARAVQDGVLREVDPALATRLLLSGLNHLPRWHNPGGRLSAAQVIDEYLDMLLNGLIARTTH